jgi:hypothetical protein
MGRKEERGFAPIIIVLAAAAAIALAGGIFYFTRKQQVPPVIVAPPPAPGPASITPTAGLTPSSSGDMSSWKTYRSDKYGFELKYPTEWIVSDGFTHATSVECQATQSCPTGGDISISASGCMNCDLSSRRGGNIEIWDAQPNETTLDALSRIYSRDGDAVVAVDRSPLSVGGMRASYYKVPQNTVDSYYHDFIDAATVANGLLYVFENPDGSNTFDQILSTFRFLD